MASFPYEIGPLTAVLNVNVENLYINYFNTILLPEAADFPGRTILIRDSTGSCSAIELPPPGPEFNPLARMILIQRSNLDLIDGELNIVRLSTAYESIQLTSDGVNNWMVTQNYKWGIPAFSTWDWFSSAQTSRLSLENAVIQSQSNIIFNQNPGNSFLYFSANLLPSDKFIHRFTFRFDPGLTTQGAFHFIICTNSNVVGNSNYFGYGIDGYLGPLMGDAGITTSIALRFVPRTETSNISFVDVLANGFVPSPVGQPLTDIELFSGRDFESIVQYNRNDFKFSFSIRDTITNSSFTSNIANFDIYGSIPFESPVSFGFVTATNDIINCRPILSTWDAFTG